MKKLSLNKLTSAYHFLFRKHRKKTLFAFGLLLIAYWACLPSPLFKDPYCLVLEDKDGSLLGARIASDGQWRFPGTDSLPSKYIEALIEFEDKRFFSHPGVDIIGLGRAISQNVKAGRIVSGGSTISMQTIRLARKNRRRNLYQKLVELVLATRLELGYSKQEILNLYSAHAPFGGNVVGLEAASWRYFGKSPKFLSWAEAAVLAVLPNSPALIHPGRNRTALKNKRNRLLDRLHAKGLIDALSCELAKEEELPEKPKALPRLAPHLLDRVGIEQKKEGRIRSTIDHSLQSQSTALLRRQQYVLAGKEIHNLAAIIIEIETGEIRAYVGNVLGAGAQHGEQVDVIRAARSSGSILKPLLYALMLQEGQLLPESLIPDIPLQLLDYRPENFNRKHDGVVSAKKALSRSLNVPMVKMLQNYSVEKFHSQLNKLGLSTLQEPPNHYGLPLILGGAEVKLEEITNVYACMARSLNHYVELNGFYNKADFRPSTYILQQEEQKKAILLKEAPRIGAAASWLTFEAMQQVERPNSLGEWELFRSSQRIAWKTGTSFGFRDAWALGVNSKYAIGVWVGNADGEGRPGLVGVKAAGPVLFELFDLLPSSSWFIPPYDDMIQLAVCKDSGYRNSALCPVDTIWAPATGVEAKTCPYHQMIHLDETRSWQVNSECEAPANMQHEAWLVLPPVEEYYYKQRDPSYKELPPWRDDCISKVDPKSAKAMQLIYPSEETKIYVPVDLDGSMSKTVFSLAHRSPETLVYWHIDNEYLGSTKTFHNMELQPKEGPHVLVLVDENGNRLEQRFEIIGKDGKKN